MNKPQHSRAIIPAPFGALILEASDSYLLYVEVKIETSGLSAPTTPLLLEATRQFNAYFDDPLRPFALPLFQQGTAYQNRVWQALSAIPPSSVKSYGQLADELHSGARAVASACRANRFPVIIPCHRVVAAHGIGGYCGVGGRTVEINGHSDMETLNSPVMEVGMGSFLDIKRWLLQHEGYEYP